MSNPPENGLQRTIGTKTLALNAINLTVGGGIFVVPAIVAVGLGAASFVAYLLCASLMILVMLCFAEIGSKVTTSGGAYAYVEYAFGPYWGFLINTLYWLGFAIVADAAIANAMVDMIERMIPELNNQWIRTVFFILLYAFFATVNVRGTKSGARLVRINTIVKLVPLTILVVYGAFHMKASNLQVTTWPTFESYGEMALILFFAFVGAESALGNSGEVKNPQKSIPRGIMLGLLGVLVIYVCIQTVAQGILGDQLPLSTEAPLASAAEQIMGHFGYQMVLIGAIISIYSTLSGDVLASSRLIYSGAKDHLLPEVFSRLHPRFRTPYWAIIAFTSLIVLIASLGDFRQLALISSSAMLIIYFAVIAATIKVRMTDKTKSNFRLPLGYFIPLLAASVVLWFLFHISIEEVKALIGFLIIASVVYFLYSRRKVRSAADKLRQ